MTAKKYLISFAYSATILFARVCKDLSPEYGAVCDIISKNKSYYADFTYQGEPVSLRLCKVTQRVERYVDIIAGWEADKYIAARRLKEAKWNTF